MRHLEDSLQMSVMEYLALLPVFAFHPKNSGYKTIPQAVRDKKLGIKPGVADVIIMWPKGIGFIELKTIKGKLSPSQIAFNQLCELWGFKYSICRSVDDVQKKLKEWEAIK